MATSKEYLAYVLEELTDLPDIRHRAMMGEYVVYYKEKVIGGIYDNNFLVKVTPSSKDLLKEASYMIPYQGLKKCYC